MKNFIKSIIPAQFIRYRAVANCGKVALTFDDGPQPGTTDVVLDTLSNFNIKATFFVLGRMVEDNPELSREIVKQGHEIGNHGYSHKVCPEMTLEEIREEIDRTDKIVEKVTGVKPAYFRPPEGALSAALLWHLIIQRNQPATMWSQLIIDESRKQKNQLIKEFKNMKLKAGDIVLLHDVNEQTAAALPDILRHIKKQRFAGVTLTEMLSANQENTSKQIA